MNQRNIIVTCDDISQSTQPLFNSLYGNSWWEGIAKMLEFLVRSGGGDEEAVSIASCQAAHYPRTGYRSVYDWDDARQFGFKHRVKVG